MGLNEEKIVKGEEIASPLLSAVHSSYPVTMPSRYERKSCDYQTKFHYHEQKWNFTSNYGLPIINIYFAGGVRYAGTTPNHLFKPVRIHITKKLQNRTIFL